MVEAGTRGYKCLAEILPSHVDVLDAIHGEVVQGVTCEDLSQFLKLVHLRNLVVLSCQVEFVLECEQILMFLASKSGELGGACLGRSVREESSTGVHLLDLGYRCAELLPVVGYLGLECIGFVLEFC